MIKLFNTCLPAGRKQKEPQSLKEVLGILEKLAGDFKKVSQELAELKKNNKKNLQKG